MPTPIVDTDASQEIILPSTSPKPLEIDGRTGNYSCEKSLNTVPSRAASFHHDIFTSRFSPKRTRQTHAVNEIVDSRYLELFKILPCLQTGLISQKQQYYLHSDRTFAEIFKKNARPEDMFLLQNAMGDIFGEQRQVLLKIQSLEDLPETRLRNVRGSSKALPHDASIKKLA